MYAYTYKRAGAGGKSNSVDKGLALFRARNVRVRGLRALLGPSDRAGWLRRHAGNCCPSAHYTRLTDSARTLRLPILAPLSYPRSTGRDVR